MLTRLFFIITFLICLFHSCYASNKILIKEKQRAIIIDNRTGKISSKILSPGEYEDLPFKTFEVFDISEARFFDKIEFLYLDGSKDSIFYTLTYSPVIDSLPAIYFNFREEYLHGFLSPTIRQTIRISLGKIMSEDLQKKSISESIILDSQNIFNGLFILHDFNLMGKTSYDKYLQKKLLDVEKYYLSIETIEDKKRIRMVRNYLAKENGKVIIENLLTKLEINDNE